MKLKKSEYHELVVALEKRYTTYAFFAPGAQLELFARDIESGDMGDALLRLSLTLVTFLALTVLTFLPFLRFEPGAFIKPSLPTVYISFLPWWIGKELAGPVGLKNIPGPSRPSASSSWKNPQGLYSALPLTPCLPGNPL